MTGNLLFDLQVSRWAAAADSEKSKNSNRKAVKQDDGKQKGKRVRRSS